MWKVRIGVSVGKCVEIVVYDHYNVVEQSWGSPGKNVKEGI